MKTFLLASFVAISLSLSAEEYISPVTGRPLPKDGKFSEEQYKARDERVMKKTGGFLVQKAEGPLGMIVDSRKKPTETVDEVARVYRLATRLDITVQKDPRGDSCPIDFAANIMATAKPLFLIVVVEDIGRQPILSVFPEERIALVNADKLKGGDDPSAPELRVDKEIWRAIGFVCGIGYSQNDNDIMQPYYSLAELDACRFPFIQPMNMLKMESMCKRFGVKKERRVPYRVACQEGWASQPTNEYQKAIWDEVHAIPTEPIKIKPETHPAK